MPGASDSCYRGRMRISWSVHRRDAKQIFEAAYLAHLLGKRRRGKGGESEPVPVTSPHPRPLSGGAEAALTFDAP